MSEWQPKSEIRLSENNEFFLLMSFMKERIYTSKQIIYARILTIKWIILLTNKMK